MSTSLAGREVLEKKVWKNLALTLMLNILHEQISLCLLSRLSF